MSNTIKYYSPGKRITLYDASVDSEFSGSLIISSDTATSKEQATSESVTVPKETVTSIDDQSRVRKPQKKQKKRHKVIKKVPNLEKIESVTPQNPVKSLEELKSLTEKISTKQIKKIGSSVGIHLQTTAKEFNPVFQTLVNKGKTLMVNATQKAQHVLVSTGRPPVSVRFLPKVTKPSFAPHYGKLSLAFLGIAFISFIGLIGPVIASDFQVQLPSFGKKQIIQPSPRPEDLYNTFFQAEHDPIYPIREFRIVVPKINLESNIVDNVDPSIEDEYKEKLQYGVAHAKGSYMPGQNGLVYLFAHSTDTVFNIARYNAKFFAVRELENGDEILLYLNGREYKYIVNGKKVINPEEINVVEEVEKGLILQTCWPPGTDWQRLIVFADPVESI